MAFRINVKACAVSLGRNSPHPDVCQAPLVGPKVSSLFLLVLFRSFSHRLSVHTSVQATGFYGLLFKNASLPRKRSRGGRGGSLIVTHCLHPLSLGDRLGDRLDDAKINAFNQIISSIKQTN